MFVMLVGLVHSYNSLLKTFLKNSHMDGKNSFETKVAKKLGWHCYTLCFKT